MNMRIETLPNNRIAYVRHIGPYGPANLHVMQQLKKWATEKHLLTESTILLGIPHDNPQTTLPEQCRYDACIVIQENELIDNAVSEGMFNGGKYVIFTIKHTTEDIQKAWAEIPSVLRSLDLLVDNKPFLERYIGNMEHNDCCEICIPVK